MKQQEFFSKGESDAWFKRNLATLCSRTNLTADPILRTMVQYGLKPLRALEIGASNGYRMQVIAESFGTEAHAIEPSHLAVEDGRQRHPLIKIQQGVATRLPYQDGEFDAVIISLVLHWVDRAQLFAAFAEIDRVLCQDGFLILSDFLPPRPERIRYHHRPESEIYTYKQDYTAAFLASGIYESICMQVFDHNGFILNLRTLPHDRCFVAILRKQLEELYLTKSRPSDV